MDSSKFSFKLFLADAAAVELRELVPVFHSFIQTHAIPDHLLIDVAAYEHVHNGPGTVLVAREANYSLDDRDGRRGLTYQRKQPISGTDFDRLRAAFRSTLEAANLLERAMEGRVRFRTDEIEFRICDRLHAPNNNETLEAVRPLLNELFPAAELIRRDGDGLLFEVMIRPVNAQPLGTLLDRTNPTHA